MKRREKEGHAKNASESKVRTVGEKWLAGSEEDRTKHGADERKAARPERAGELRRRERTVQSKQLYSTVCRRNNLIMTIHP